MHRLRRTPNSNRGFTMVEMVVVATIIGVLSMVAAPRYRQAIERARASQAFYFMAHVQAAQERYYVVTGEYSRDLRRLDGTMAVPLGFKIKMYGSANWEQRWRLVLEREGASNGYGSYRLAWTHEGFDFIRSNLSEQLWPTGFNKDSLQSAKERGFLVR